jgi:hypothetical protein
MGKSWDIDIRAPFSGFAPAYWTDDYPSYGNKNQAGKMQNVDILNPVFLTQGPGLSNLTNGTQAGVLSTLMKHILEVPTADSVGWGIGGNKLYKITPTTLTSDGNYPHTIDKAAVTAEDGESVIEDNGYLYYFYNHSGGNGDIGRLTIATNTFDDDWGSTVPATGAGTIDDAPHPVVKGKDGIIYFGNGRYVGYYDPVNDTLSVDELDLPPNVQVVDLAYDNDLLYIAYNYPNLTGDNNNRGGIVTWKGPGFNSWESYPAPEFLGKIGAIYKKDGTLYVWYQDASIDAFKLGYLNGNKIDQLRSYDGSLPNFGQRMEYKNMLFWISNGVFYCFGSQDRDLKWELSQYADGGHATVGAIAVPFGTPLVCSNDGGSNYRIAGFSGYDTACNWKGLMFPCAYSMIDEVLTEFEATAANARCDLTLRYDRGASSLALASKGQTGSITHTNDSSIISKSFYPKLPVEDFRVELDWSNGNATNPLKIRRIHIKGHFLDK